MVFQEGESGSDSQYQRLEIREALITGTSYVNRREEAEDIFNRLGELPELQECQRKSTQLFGLPRHLRLSNMDHLLQYLSLRKAGICPA